MDTPLHGTDLDLSTCVCVFSPWFPFLSWCAPCKLLAPVMDSLADAYDGTLKARSVMGTVPLFLIFLLHARQTVVDIYFLRCLTDMA